MDIVDKLTEIFKEFPGIGERQAKRFVYFLMSRNGSYSQNLAHLILDLKKEISQCKECFRFFVNTPLPNLPLIKGEVSERQRGSCEICSNLNTEDKILMIIEKDSDLESIHKSRIYHGKYFILGGLVPIIEKNMKSRVRINELLDKIKKTKNLEEIILAFSISPQGNHTDFYIRNQIKDICENKNIKISSLGRGLSTGTELEYSDNETIKNALQNRH